MATRYVETPANGGGQSGADGTQALPWTWEQARAAYPTSAVAGGDLFLIGPGVHSAAAEWVHNRYDTAIRGAAGATVQASAGGFAAGAGIVYTGSFFARVEGLTLSPAGNCAYALRLGHRASSASDCTLNAGTSAAVWSSTDQVKKLSRCRLNGYPVAPENGEFGGTLLERCHLDMGGNDLAGMAAGRAVNCLVRNAATWGVFNTPVVGCVVRGGSYASLGYQPAYASVLCGGGGGGATAVRNADAICCYAHGHAALVDGAVYGHGDVAASSAGSALLASSPFLADPNAGATADLRLSAEGRRHPALRAILAGLHGVPGVLLDAVADLQAPRNFPVVGPAWADRGVVG